MWAQSTPSWKEFSIGPSTKGGGRYMRDGITGEGVPLKRLLSKTFGVPENRILAPDWVGLQRYKLTATVNNPDDFAPLMKQELAARFQLLSHPENRAIPVWVVKAIAGTQNSVKPATAEAPPGMMGLRLNQTTMTEFLNNLADLLHRPVFDESHIDGFYQMSLWWKPNDTASLKAAVKDQLGCELVEETRNVDLLIIDRIERPHFDTN